jgi:two-component system sensor histidine kinase KdpD
MERLYDFSRSLMLLNKESPTASQVSARILDTFGLRGVAVFDREDDRVYRSGVPDIPITDLRLRSAALQNTPYQETANGLYLLPLQLGGNSVGGLAISGGSISDAAWHAIANLAAIAMEKARAERAAGRIEATLQNEAMKATLLDALAHEFTTPLTSIKAAASSILDEVGPVQQELVTIIEEETDRLDSLVRETIRMGRIEAGNIRLTRHPQMVRDFIASALQKLKSLLDEREIQINVADDIPAVMVDADHASLALRQLLTNAVKYSNPNSPIIVGARREEAHPGFVVISVKDRGPGIPAKELSRIFDKFYRVPDHSDRVPGTGMGLNIAREIIRAHGGDIRVESNVGEGTEFSFTLPCAGRPA